MSYVKNSARDAIVGAVSAWYNAKKFTAYVDGCEMVLATGEKLKFRVERVEPLVRKRGYRFYRHAFVTRMRANGITESGCGEANSKLLAIEKSIAEAVERVSYRALKGTSFGSANSNGWAAHRSSEKAKEAALLELIERDASLVHWLGRTPMLEMDPASFPGWLSDWAKDELAWSKFPTLRILVSTKGFLPTVTSVLLNRDGFGVASHAAGRSLNSAIGRSTSEACRLAHLAAENSYVLSAKKLFSPELNGQKFGPHHHAVVYAYHKEMPQWIFGERMRFREIRKYWNKAYNHANPLELDSQFDLVARGPLYVGRCQSAEVQNLFFGPTASALESGVINKRRTNMNDRSCNLNVEPHFVA